MTDRAHSGCSCDLCKPWFDTAEVVDDRLVPELGEPTRLLRRMPDGSFRLVTSEQLTSVMSTLE